MICDDCYQAYLKGMAATFLRRSHHWSFWCEHSITDDWYAGHQPPLMMRITNGADLASPT